MRTERHACPRCDGEVFLLRTDGRVLCAGCRFEHQSLRVLDPRVADRSPDVLAGAKAKK